MTEYEVFANPIKQYKIFVNSNGNYKAVKQGWSWPAFFFCHIWAIIKRMWAIFLGLFIWRFVFAYISSYSDTRFFIIYIISFIINIVCGIYGNKWVEDSLYKRKYDFKETIKATNKKEAILLYIKNVNPIQET